MNRIIKFRLKINSYFTFNRNMTRLKRFIFSFIVLQDSVIESFGITD